MCQCGHKLKLHASAATAAAAVDYPAYWTSSAANEDEFNILVPVGDGMLAKFQQLLDITYSDKTTRDRANHSGSWMVPRGFAMVAAWRNENSKLWRKYCVRKAEMQKEQAAEESAGDPPTGSRPLPPLKRIDDVETSGLGSFG